MGLKDIFNLPIFRHLETENGENLFQWFIFFSERTAVHLAISITKNLVFTSIYCDGLWQLDLEILFDHPLILFFFF